ncbi:hypothetical protein KBD81_00855 [Candidatus Woesebacteria bacterium]|nr:hypothetical protein [Candidatus Woesebacteria bacterium]
MKNSIKRKSLLSILLIAALISVYLLLRIKPLLAHSVAYTYDQGRDMMKAAEIVLYKDLTFIGPTTGIEGLFHGAWWYYYLTIPYAIFGGTPIGFYVANIIIQLASLVTLIYFIRKYMSVWVAGLVGLLVAISPYFIGTSLFIGNNIMTLPAMLAFVLTHVVLLEQFPKKRLSQIVLFVAMGISLGLIAEFEFAFGLMIIPVYMVLLFAIPTMRKLYFSHFNFMFAFSGLAFAFLPRALFELKNNFAQTRTLLSFVIEPKLYNPKAYSDVFFDRLDLVTGFYRVIFDGNTLLWIISGALALILLGLVWKRKPVRFKNSLVFFSLLILGLFLFSTVYKDNFWPNYYEGFPYLYLILIALIFAQVDVLGDIAKRKNITLMSSLVVVIAMSLFLVQKSLQTSIVIEGLKVQEDVVQYIESHVGADTNYCLRVYTPPVIPHTYNYLFFHEQQKGRIKQASADFVNGECWYIVERDDFAERRQAWLDANLPEDGELKSEKKFRDVQVQLWHVTNKDNE